MKKFISVYIVPAICLQVFCIASSAQIRVLEKFDKLFLGENFDSSNAYWNTISNADNLLIVQDGEYIMHRKSNVSPFAVIGNFYNDLTVFKLIASLKLDKISASDGSIGLIFMAQPDGKGGFIFEINKNSYRLRQIEDNNYKFLTGTAKNGGWVESLFVKGLNISNLIEIRTSANKFDLLLNNNYLLEFNNMSYRSGNFGFIIGPSSKGKADFIYIFTTLKDKNDAYDDSEKNYGEEKINNSPATDILALAESIIMLKTQIDKLTEENDDLKQINQAIREGEKENEKQKENFENQIRVLELSLRKSSNSYDSLLKVNIDLNRYKEMVIGNDNGDLVINLSKNLKKEKINNNELSKANKLLRDTLAVIKFELKTLKSNKESTINIKNEKSIIDSVQEKKPIKKEFVLPKEIY